jgi:hypothetical protein
MDLVQRVGTGGRHGAVKRQLLLSRAGPAGPAEEPTRNFHGRTMFCRGASGTASLGLRRLACRSGVAALGAQHVRQSLSQQCGRPVVAASPAARGAHSDTTIHYHSGFRVHQFPILDDNYSYLIVDEVTNEAAAVDPADPERTLAEVDAAELSLTTVLCTHKHWDHAQGNDALAAHIAGLRVVGPALEDCPAATELVSGEFK